MQPTGVQEDHVSPPRVETTIAIQQTQPFVWETAESEEDTHTGITAGHGDTDRQTDGEQDRNNNTPHYTTQDEEDTPA